MAEGEPPVTRFSVAPEPLSNVTLLVLPIEKLFQSITPRVEPGCVIRRPLPWLAIAPVPGTYVPPCGRPPAADATGVRDCPLSEMPMASRKAAFECRRRSVRRAGRGSFGRDIH